MGVYCFTILYPYRAGSLITAAANAIRKRTTTLIRAASKDSRGLASEGRSVSPQCGVSSDTSVLPLRQSAPPPDADDHFDVDDPSPKHSTLRPVPSVRVRHPSQPAVFMMSQLTEGGDVKAMAVQQQQQGALLSPTTTTKGIRMSMLFSYL